MIKELLIAFISLGLISCSAYQKISVSPEDALNKGKVKVITNSGNEVKLENILYEDSALIGMKDSVKIPINTSQIQSIYLAYPSEPILTKNAVYGTLALINLSINYERVIVGANAFDILLKASFGFFYVPEGIGEKSKNGVQFLVQFIMLHGRASNFIEYGIGLGSWYQPADATGIQSSINGLNFGSHTSSPSSQEDLNFFPAVNLGYRHQKSLKSPIFRFGIGFPEILYFSIGYGF